MRALPGILGEVGLEFEPYQRRREGPTWRAPPDRGKWRLMFTGLVETVGTVIEASGASPRRLTIASSIDPAGVAIGASVAIDGCCLTVVAKSTRGLTFEAATETLARTTLGALAASDRVNLEQALRVGDRLGGHLVLGHVDGLGTLRTREQRGSAWYLGIEAPAELAPLIAARGSITVAGVSLTVTGVEGKTFYIGVIPHTWQVTHLPALAVGAAVNLEADVVARYVQRLLAAGGDLAKAPALTKEFLESKGFA